MDLLFFNIQIHLLLINRKIKESFYLLEQSLALSTRKHVVRELFICACLKVEKHYFVKYTAIKHFYTFRLASSHLYLIIYSINIH